MKTMILRDIDRSNNPIPNSAMGLRRFRVCDIILVVTEANIMDADRTIYVCTCKNRKCPGRTVIECCPSVSRASGFDHSDLLDCPSCPLCGRAMEMVPMGSEDTEFLPEVPDPESIRLKIRSRTIFKPIDEETGKAITSVIPTSADDRESDVAEDQRKRFLTEEDVARILGISVDKVRSLVNGKRLSCAQISPNIRRFTIENIDDFMRRESGLPTRQGLDIGKILAPKPAQSMPIEESRELLRKIRKKD